MYFQIRHFCWEIRLIIQPFSGYNKELPIWNFPTNQDCFIGKKQEINKTRFFLALEKNCFWVRLNNLQLEKKKRSIGTFINRRNAWNSWITQKLYKIIAIQYFCPFIWSPRHSSARDGTRVSFSLPYFSLRQTHTIKVE